MDHSVDIFGCKGDLLAKLSDKAKWVCTFGSSLRVVAYVVNRISATQAVTCSHPSIVERVATGNGTGRCLLWAPADPDDDVE